MGEKLAQLREEEVINLILYERQSILKYNMPILGPQEGIISTKSWYSSST